MSGRRAEAAGHYKTEFGDQMMVDDVLVLGVPIWIRDHALKKHIDRCICRGAEVRPHVHVLIKTMKPETRKHCVYIFLKRHLFTGHTASR